MVSMQELRAGQTIHLKSKNGKSVKARLAVPFIIRKGGFVSFGTKNLFNNEVKELSAADLEELNNQFDLSTT